MKRLNNPFEIKDRHLEVSHRGDFRQNGPGLIWLALDNDASAYATWGGYVDEKELKAQVAQKIQSIKEYLKFLEKWLKDL